MTLRMKYPSLNQFIENNFNTDDETETVVDKTFKVVVIVWIQFILVRCMGCDYTLMKELNL